MVNDIAEKEEGLHEISIEGHCSATAQNKDNLEKLNVRKAQGTDGISNWAQRECRDISSQDTFTDSEFQ